MLVAEVIVRIFEKEGIKHALNQASINPVYKYLKDSTIKHCLMRHEEAAVHAADGYYRSSSRLVFRYLHIWPGSNQFNRSVPLPSILSRLLQLQVKRKSTNWYRCVPMRCMHQWQNQWLKKLFVLRSLKKLSIYSVI